MAIESYFEDIADAIRERGGTSATLTPAAMPQAILDIPGGGGSGVPEITPVYKGFSYSYISNFNYQGYTVKENYIMIFDVANVTALLFFKLDTLSNRFQATYFPGRNSSEFLPGVTTPSYPTINGGSVWANYTNDRNTHAGAISGTGYNGVLVLQTSRDNVAGDAYLLDISQYT